MLNKQQTIRVKSGTHKRTTWMLVSLTEREKRGPDKRGRPSESKLMNAVRSLRSVNIFERLECPFKVRALNAFSGCETATVAALHSIKFTQHRKLETGLHL